MGSGIQTTQSEDLFEEMLNKITIPVVGGAWLGDIFIWNIPCIMAYQVMPDQEQETLFFRIPIVY